MHKRSLCRGAPSVRLSTTYVYSVEASKHIFKKKFTAETTDAWHGHAWVILCMASDTIALFISGEDGRDDQQLSIGTLSNIAVNFN